MNCVLRPYREADREQFFDLFSDPDVMRFVGDGRPVRINDHPPLFDRIFEKRRTDPSFHIWAIEEDGRYIGHAELKRRADRSEYELVYLLRRSCWGRGLGGTVVDLLLNEARRRRFPFVIATVDRANHASIAILRRRGFVRDEELSAALGAQAFRLSLERLP